MKRLAERIQALGRLKYNWDSYGGLPPTLAAMRSADHFNHCYVRQADEGRIHACPTGDGGAALSALDCDGDEVNIVFRPDGTWKLDDCVPLAEREVK